MKIPLKRIGWFDKLYLRIAFYLRRNKDPLSDYKWRRYFCWYPVVVSDYWNKKTIVWLSRIWRMGPFIPQAEDGNSFKTVKGVYEYSIKNPIYGDSCPTISVNREGRKDRVLDLLIADRSRFFYHQKWLESEKKQLEARLKVIQKVLSERDMSKIVNIPPKPIAEISGAVDDD
jgi:hypothetical protein